MRRAATNVAATDTSTPIIDSSPPSKPHALSSSPPSSPSLYQWLSTNPYVVYPFVVLLFVAFQLCLSWLFTGSLHFGLLPSAPVSLTPAQLALHDGVRSPSIYLAILGEVFDVTSGSKYYGPDGGYHAFAGKDGSRAFITGCFDSGAVPDVRGLGEKEIRALEKWRDFYRDHQTYRYVGKVSNPAIPPDAPLPNDDCK